MAVFWLKKCRLLLMTTFSKWDGAIQDMRLKSLAPRKVSVFSWRASGIIMTCVELDKRGIDFDFVLCKCCGDGVVDHVMVF